MKIKYLPPILALVAISTSAASIYMNHKINKQREERRKKVELPAEIEEEFFEEEFDK